MKEPEQPTWWYRLLYDQGHPRYEDAAMNMRRALAEKTVALAAKHFPHEREWPEIVYEDILDAEVIDD